MKKNLFRGLSYLAIATPGIYLLVRYFLGDLGANPIQEATHVTGRMAINILVATLAISPIIDLFKVRWISPLRRWLGVSSFLYASVHFLIFVWWDYGLNLTLILEILFEKWFAFLGIATFLIFAALAITSTNNWQKKMGKRWKKLHYLVYFSGFTASLHYLLAVKLDLRRPIVFAAIIALLLIMRVKVIKKMFNSSTIKNIVPSNLRSLKLL